MFDNLVNVQWPCHMTTVVTMVSAREQTTRELGGQVRTAETRGETWANDEWLVVVVSHKLY